MKTFVVNLEKDTKKKNYIIGECFKYKISPEIISAVYGAGLPDSIFINKIYNYPECALTKPEIGCALSHLYIYKIIVQRNLKLALILEDDVILEPTINDALTIIKQIDDPKTPNMYLLSRTNDYKKKPMYKNDILSIHKFYNSSGAFAYVVNHKACEILLMKNYMIKFEPDRWSIFNLFWNLNTYCILPHLATVNSIQISDLEGGRIKMKRQRDLFIRKLTHQNRNKRVKYVLWKIFIKPFLNIKKTGY